MPGGGPRHCAASSSCPPPRSRHFADPVSWQARLLIVGGECDTGINDSEDAGGATPCASRCLASRTEEGLARLCLAVSMGRAALLAERNEDVSHFDPHPSRNYSRTPGSRCELWPSNSFPELESSAVLRLANRQTRPPGLRATACGLCISGVSPERGSGKFQDHASREGSVESRVFASMSLRRSSRSAIAKSSLD